MEDNHRRAAIALAATYFVGEERDKLLAEAVTSKKTSKTSAKLREVENLGR